MNLKVGDDVQKKGKKVSHICKNYIKILHADQKMLMRFKDGIEKRNLLQSFFPIITKNQYSDEAFYNWGVEQDIISGSLETVYNLMMGSGIFYTIELPPIIAFEKLAKLGFDIDVNYVVETPVYAGSWNNKMGDHATRIDFDGYIPPEYLR